MSIWFPLNALSRTTDPTTFSRGQALYRAQKIARFDLKPARSGSAGFWELTGKVQGTQPQPYEVSVDLQLLPDAQGGLTLGLWHGDCDCPVGFSCKHAVALLVKAANEGERMVDALSGLTPQERAQKAAALALQQQQVAEQQRRQRQTQLAERWLLDPDSVPAPANRLLAAVGVARPPDAQSPIYLLSVHHSLGERSVLRIGLGASTLKVKGGWSKPRSVTPHYFRSSQHQGQAVELTELDHDILTLLIALPPVVDTVHYSGASDWTLDTVAAALVLERVSATGRLFWREDNGALGEPIAWGPALPLAWRWEEQTETSAHHPDPPEPVWRLQPQLTPPQAMLCANKPLLYLHLSRRTCGPVEGGADPHQHDLLQAPALPLQVMQKNPVALLRRLGTAVALPPVLPAQRRVGGVPTWRLYLSRLIDLESSTPTAPHTLSVQLDFDYEGCQGWWMDAENPVVFEREGGDSVLLQRDLGSEAQALERLRELGLAHQEDGIFGLANGVSLTRWLQWADAQFQPLREAGFAVDMDADLHHWVRPAGELTVDLVPQDGSEGGGETSAWFDLSLGLEVNGQRVNLLPILPQIIADLRQTEQGPEPVWPEHIYLPTANGQGFYRVATAPLKPWLDGLLELFDDRAKDFDADSLRLSRIDALRARVALGEGVVWQGAQGLNELAERLKGQTGLPSTPLPEGLHAELRPYQHQGLDWLQFLRRHGLAGILADDMGLGKTLQTLAHIQCEKEAGRLDRPALVVVPVSLLGNWQREAARFCPGLRCRVLHGAERHGQAADLAQADLVLTSYSLLYRDRERWLAQAWHLVVLDEAQNIKNAATQSAQVAGELNTRHRLCLSGTPIENHLGEIWSLFHFLMPGFLGSQPRFAKRFRQPIEKHGDSARMAQLRARLTPFILRRTKQLVATELPPKVETVMSVEIGGQQADLYETIRLSMEQTVRQAITSKGLAKSQIAILDALLKLRQVCCDPRLVKTEAATKVKASAKLEQLMEMLPEMLAEGRRILLFSQFTSMLSLIEDELRKHKLTWTKLTGQTQKRDDVIARFTSGEVPIFLISLKAGGVGLNLPQADTVIHYDPWWNPAAENQATDRAHRIGQTQSVWVIKLVAQGTIEERILALQERKAELARELYSGAAARKQPLFTQDDVQALLLPMN
jgi:superfamily II DNA or RNA helicase